MKNKPPATEYRPQLDALRAFAVLGVLITHFWQPGPYPGVLTYVDLGFLGVRLFFVLSGFLITRILLACRGEYERGGSGRLSLMRQFYIRRFLRIFPLYYLIVLGALAVGVPPARAAWPWLMSYTLNFYVTLTPNGGGYFGHFWTLAVEEQFYFVWPWLVLFLPWRWLLASVVAVVGFAPVFREIAFRVVGADWGPLPWGSMDTLGMGAMLAIAFHRAPSKEALHGALARVVLPAGLVAYLGLHAIAGQPTGERLLVAFHEIAYAMICCWLIASADRGFTGVPGRILTLRPLVYLGKISYGVYAYHMLMTWVLVAALPRLGLQVPGPGAVRFVIGSLATLAVAAASWHVYERPINDLKRRFPYRVDRSGVEPVHVDRTLHVLPTREPMAGPVIPTSVPERP
jgi:peptidoglycan/LPS O-acetylase OafA/YrhL